MSKDILALVPVSRRRLLGVGDDALVCVSDEHELVARLAESRWIALVIDAPHAGDVRRMIAAARDAAVGCIVIDAAEAPGDGIESCSGCTAATTVPRLVRSWRGEPMRAWPRIRDCGSVRVDRAHAVGTLRIRDLSEDGVALDAPSVPVPSDVRLELQLAQRATVTLPATLVRRTGGASPLIAYRFVGLSIAERAALRAAIAASSAPATPPAGEVAPRRRAAPAARTARPFIGESEAMRQIHERLERVAPTDESVLIIGETGTGKELVAQALHRASRRAHKPFVAVNCAALPAELVESELFGYEAGAFTGALKRKIGRLEQASGGTLFLDEVGDLSPAAQPKLLRALQERTFERVGGSDPVPVDLRIVAATNHRLDASNERFRRDLYYRLNVVTIDLPPLRERPEDVPLLVEHFLERARTRMNRRDVCLTAEAAALLTRQRWLGNVRELESLCNRVVALAQDGDEIGVDRLGLEAPELPASSPLPAVELRDLVDFCEREIVRRVLKRHRGNRTHAASALGISRQALQQRIQRLCVAPDGDGHGAVARLVPDGVEH